ATVPLQVDDGGGRRQPALALLLLEVGDRVLLGHAAQPVDRPGLVEERLDERGLPGSAVADHRHIADLAWLLLGHGPNLALARMLSVRPSPYRMKKRGLTPSFQRLRSSEARSRLPWSFALRRRIALVCSWETRDSVTPSTSPISRSVSSS